MPPGWGNVYPACKHATLVGLRGDALRHLTRTCILVAQLRNAKRKCHQILAKIERCPGDRRIFGGRVMTIRLKAAFKDFGGIVAAALALCACTASRPTPAPVDPGVRGGAAGAGTPLPGLTADETAFFQDGLARFAEIEVVTGSNNNGLGPRFNSNQCLSCHSQPAPAGRARRRTP